MMAGRIKVSRAAATDPSLSDLPPLEARSASHRARNRSGGEAETEKRTRRPDELGVMGSSRGNCDLFQDCADVRRPELFVILKPPTNKKTYTTPGAVATHWLGTAPLGSRIDRQQSQHG